jgi:hypothetical protein
MDPSTEAQEERDEAAAQQQTWFDETQAMIELAEGQLWSSWVISTTRKELFLRSRDGVSVMANRFLGYYVILRSLAKESYALMLLCRALML